MTKIAPLVLGVVAALAATQLPAAEAAKKNAATSGGALPSSQIANLTVSECKRLGGFTEQSSRCRTGTTCITITRDYVEHSSCITEVE